MCVCVCVHLSLSTTPRTDMRCLSGCSPPPDEQARILELEAGVSSAEGAHRTAHGSLLDVTTERDDLKEAVSTLRKRIRDIEGHQVRTLAEVGHTRM